MMVKRTVQKALRTLGYDIARHVPEPYEDIAHLPRYVEHTVSLLNKPFQVADVASFRASYREIFVEEIYRFETGNPVPRIIDCGANYGVSVIYLKQLFPKARLTAVEADAGIFGILKQNIDAAGLGDVDLRQMAVSADNTPLRFHSEGADGGRVHELLLAKAVQVVDAITLDELIDGPVDFLKMDIEGAEASALAACTKLDQVSQMFIEYHSFTDSEQALAKMLAQLSAAGFRYYIHSQFCSPRPLTLEQSHMGMDLQLNIFAKRPA